MSEPRGRTFPALTLSVIAHVAVFAALILLTSWADPMSLTSDGDGNPVTVALLAGGPSEAAPPPPPARTPRPQPQPTPAPKIPEPTPEIPPKPEEKPAPTPVPQKEEIIIPKETEKPKPTATPTPRRPDPTPTKRPEPTPAPKAPEPTSPPRTPAPTPAPRKPDPTRTPTPTRESVSLSPDRARELRGTPRPPARPTTTRTTSTGSASSASKALSPSDKAAMGGSASASRAGAATGTTDVTRGGTGMKGTGLPEFYAVAALEKLAKYFNVPPDKQREVSAVLRCRIDASGRISNIAVVQSSGDSELDGFARTALERCQTFSPFPDSFDKPHVDVEISFTFRQ